jgi:hypothetical protein
MTKDELQRFATLNEFQKTIAIWRRGRSKWQNFVNGFIPWLKRQRAEVQRGHAAVELFRDQFEFETGLDTSKGDGKTAFEDAMRVHVQRAEAKKEFSEERELSGSLMDGFDGGSIIDGFNNEEDQIADALCTADPSLRKYRNGFIK